MGQVRFVCETRLEAQPSDEGILLQLARRSEMAKAVLAGALRISGESLWLVVALACHQVHFGLETGKARLL